jgi:hypothetical protein
MPAKIHLDPSLDGRVCETCGNLLVRRRREKPSHWISRRFCSRECTDQDRFSVDRRFAAGYRETLSGCWEWQRQRHYRGYGLIEHHGRPVMAHRFAYARYVGVIPEGAVVMHRCDNPPCCNPGHLRTGTQAENIADAKAKGRLAFGERNGNAKINSAQVAAIRSSPKTLSQLAKEYGLSRAQLSRIRNGKRWAA